MSISEAIRKRAFRGFYVWDCAVIDRYTYSFILYKNGRKDTGDRRLVTYTARGEGDIAGRNYTGFPFPMLAISRHPHPVAIMVGTDAGVAALGSGEDDLQMSLRDLPGQLIWGVTGLAAIDQFVYVAGGHRDVCFRQGKDDWQSIRANLPRPAKGFETKVGFDAISGFSREDIYAVGGYGDAWRFDGKLWHQCPLPTNMLLESVCCAGDGNVYIGMQSGRLMRGRENHWEIIHEDTMSLAFKDMVWFDGRLWCTSDYGIWTVENGKLVDPDLPPGVKACAGNLSTADGVLLVGGLSGAALYDGQRWERLL